MAWVRGSHGYCGQALVHSDLGLRLSSNLMTLGKSLHFSETRFSLLESENHNSAHSEACVVVKITE